MKLSATQFFGVILLLIGLFGTSVGLVFLGIPCALIGLYFILT